MSAERIAALECATRIACEGDRESWAKRADATLALAERFLGFLAPPPDDDTPPTPAAPAQRLAA